MSDPYEPEPIDTSGVEVPKDLMALGETLARHVHEVWARTRLDAGWTVGPVRDDALKQHPCLVPYDELPESERDVDRNTVLGTIEAMLALGWQLQPPEE